MAIGTALNARSVAVDTAVQPTASAVPAAAPVGRDDLALVNARVITLDPTQPSAEAVLVRGGRIAHVGTSSDVKAKAAGARVRRRRPRRRAGAHRRAHAHGSCPESRDVRRGRTRAAVEEHSRDSGGAGGKGRANTERTTPGSSDAWFKIACVAATTAEGGGAPAGEALEFKDALRMFTLWNAQSGYEHRDKGSIAAGKLGDFAVLSGDPLSVPPKDLFAMKVDATILGGTVVYQR